MFRHEPGIRGGCSDLKPTIVVASLALLALSAACWMAGLSEAGDPSATNVSVSRVEIWAGRTEWSHFGADVVDFTSPSLVSSIAFVLGGGEIGTGAMVIVGNGSVGPDFERPSDGLLVAPWSVNISAIPRGLRLEVDLGADWVFAGPPSGELEIVLFYTTVQAIVGVRTGVFVEVHSVLAYRSPPQLLVDSGFGYEPGTWLANNSQARLLAGPIAYRDTAHMVLPSPTWMVRLAVDLDTMPRFVSNVTVNREDVLNETVIFVSANEAGTALAEVSLIIRGLPTDLAATLRHEWRVLIDGLQPNLAVAGRDLADQLEFPGGHAAIAFRACDDHAGVDLNAPPGVVVGAPAGAIRSMSAYWLPLSTAGPCVDGMIEFEDLQENVTIQVWGVDLAGNRGSIDVALHLSVSTRRVLLSAFEPAWWVRQWTFTLRARVTSASLDYSEIGNAEFSMTDRPADPREWNPLAAASWQSDARLSANVSVNRDGEFYLIWRARPTGIVNWTYSPMLAVRVDSSPPVVQSGWECTSTGRAVGPFSLEVVVFEPVSGVDLRQVELSFTRPGEAPLVLNETRSSMVARGLYRIAWSGQLSRGEYDAHLRVVDVAGNSADLPVCRVIVDDGSAALPELLGTPSFLLVVSLILACLLIASLWIRRAGRSPRP